MESFSERSNHKQVADNIRENTEFINKKLENSKIDSRIANSEQNILDFVSLDVDGLVKNIPKSDYYDLEEVGKIFAMLEPPKQDVKRRLKATKSGSLITLTPSHSTSIEAADGSSENVNEITSHLKEIRGILESINTSRIASPDLEAIKTNQTSINTNFVDLVRRTVQKLESFLYFFADCRS
jgi:hypothetical protein